MDVHPQLDEGARERIATRLGIATMTVLAAAKTWSRSWTTRGTAILAVLTCVPLSASLPIRVTEAGAAVALWAPPSFLAPNRARGFLPTLRRSAKRGAAFGDTERGPPTTSPESI